MNNDFLPKEWAKVHHAYIVSGLSSDFVWKLLNQNLSFKKRSNADAYSREYDTLGIDEAREISAWAIMKPIASENKVAVISANIFTTEAQNALLKLFEEPSLGTYFFVILPSAALILPTLLSRVRMVVEQESEDDKKLKLFLEATVVERLKIISTIVKSKNKERVRLLLKILEQGVNMESGELKSKYKRAEKVLQARRFLNSRGASLKIILEHLSVSL